MKPEPDLYTNFPLSNRTVLFELESDSDNGHKSDLLAISHCRSELTLADGLEANIFLTPSEGGTVSEVTPEQISKCYQSYSRKRTSTLTRADIG